MAAHDAATALYLELLRARGGLLARSGACDRAIETYRRIVEVDVLQEEAQRQPT